MTKLKKSVKILPVEFIRIMFFLAWKKTRKGPPHWVAENIQGVWQHLMEDERSKPLGWKTFFLHCMASTFILYSMMVLHYHALLSLPSSGSQEGDCNTFRLLQHLPRKSLCLQQGPNYRRPLSIKSLVLIQCLAFLSMHLHGSSTKSVRMLTKGFLPVPQQNTLFVATHYQQGYCELNEHIDISGSKTWLNYAPGTCKDLTGVFFKEKHWLSAYCKAAIPSG